MITKIIKNFLVPLDGSQNSIRALKVAINLAKFTNSRIIGLYVIPKDISSLPMVELLQPLSTLKPIGFKEKISKKETILSIMLKISAIRIKLNFLERLFLVILLTTS